MLLLALCSFLPILALTQYSCITGYSWNSTLLGCYPPSPECSNGYSWNGRNCRPQVNCQASMVYNGVQCVDFANNCPLGFIRWGTTCLNCPRGYRLIDSNQSCLLDIKTCQANMYWNGQVCIVDNSSVLRVNQSKATTLQPIILAQPNSSTTSAPLNSPVYQSDSGISQLILNATNNRSNSIPNPPIVHICPTNFDWNGSVCLNNKTEGQLIQIVITERNLTDEQRTRNGNNSLLTVVRTNTTILECLSGYYYNGKDCSPDSLRPFCIQGYSWNNSICVNGTAFLNGTLNSINSYQSTLQNTTSRNATSTPPNNPANSQLFSLTTQTTTTNQTVTCPSGTIFNGVNCLPTMTNNICIPGYDWNGQMCVESRNQASSISSITPSQTFSTLYNTPICPSGFDWNGGICQPRPNIYDCTSGFIWNGTACAQSTPPPIINTTSPTPTVPRQCFGGHTLNALNECIGITTALCRNNFFFNGVVCVSNLGVVQCASGFVWNSNGTSCIRDTNNAVPSVPAFLNDNNNNILPLVQFPPQTIVTSQTPSSTQTNSTTQSATSTSLQSPLLPQPLVTLPTTPSLQTLPPATPTPIQAPIVQPTPPASTSTSTTTITTTFPLQNPNTSTNLNIPGTIFAARPIDSNANTVFPIYNQTQTSSGFNQTQTVDQTRVDSGIAQPLVFITSNPQSTSNTLIPVGVPTTNSATQTQGYFLPNYQPQPSFQPQLPPTPAPSQAGGWSLCTDSQYWNGRQCVRYQGLMTCLPGYFWNWSTSRCG